MDEAALEETELPLREKYCGSQRSGDTWPPGIQARDKATKDNANHTSCLKGGPTRDVGKGKKKSEGLPVRASIHSVDVCACHCSWLNELKRRVVGDDAAMVFRGGRGGEGQVEDGFVLLVLLVRVCDCLCVYLCACVRGGEKA